LVGIHLDETTDIQTRFSWFCIVSMAMRKHNSLSSCAV